LAPGTVTDGLEQLEVLLRPIDEALKVKLRLTRPWFSQFPDEMVKLGHHG